MTWTEPASACTSRTRTGCATVVVKCWRANAYAPTTLSVANAIAMSARANPATNHAVRARRLRARRGANGAGVVMLVIVVTSRPEPLEDRKHAAVVGFGGLEVELREDVADVLLDRAVTDHEFLCDRRVGAPFRHEAENFALAWRQTIERVALARTREELRHYFGIERGATRAHTADRVDEVAHVGDSVLEQV